MCELGAADELDSQCRLPRAGLSRDEAYLPAPDECRGQETIQTVKLLHASHEGNLGNTDIERTRCIRRSPLSQLALPRRRDIPGHSISITLVRKTDNRDPVGPPPVYSIMP